MQLHFNQFSVSFDRPLVMGIVNVTPDSFSDGGRYVQVDAAVSHALQLLEQGADILDIGGESTRPHAIPVSEEEELARVLPVIEALAGQVKVPISIDTFKPRVMAAAIAAGATMVNDINALQDAEAMRVVAEHDVAVCLMHKQGVPQTMQIAPSYESVIDEVFSFLQHQILICEQNGIQRQRIVVDPGFGFGKTLVHNLTLLSQLSRLQELGAPVLVGLSRKSMLGAITGQAPEQRVVASVAAALLAVQRGAQILRVHDVQATVDALKVLSAVEQMAVV